MLNLKNLGNKNITTNLKFNKSRNDFRKPRLSASQALAKGESRAGQSAAGGRVARECATKKGRRREEYKVPSQAAQAHASERRRKDENGSGQYGHARSADMHTAVRRVTARPKHLKHAHAQHTE